MTGLLTRVVALCCAGLLIAACGTTAEPPAASKGTATSAATTSKAASSAPAGGTAAASATSAAAPAQKAAAGAADACALLTVDEVGRVMAASGVRAEGQPELAGATYCIYRDAAGTPVLATSYVKAGAAVFNAVAASMQPQSGLGDRAQWDATSATLHVLKGQTLFTLSAGDGSTATERRLDLARQLATIGVARQ